MANSQIVKKYVFNILLIIVGTFLMGISFSVFLSPNNISPAGFSGIASLVSNVVKSETGFYLSPSILYLAMNAILFVLAFKSMGVEFIVLSIAGVLSFSLSMWICTLFTLDVGSDLLLCALYGGLLMGLGSGIVIRVGGSTGGGDTIACMLKHANARISTGQIILSIDAVLVVASCFAYGISYGMYAIITCLVMSYVCDTVINGVKGTRAYYIVTSKPEEVYAAISKIVHRGMTEIKGKGMYTHHDKSILMCLLSRSEIVLLKRAVRQTDNQAFMFSIDVKEAIGVGFEPLLKEKQTKEEIINKQEGDNIKSPPQNERLEIEPISKEDAIVTNNKALTPKSKVQTKSKKFVESEAKK